MYAIDVLTLLAEILTKYTKIMFPKRWTKTVSKVTKRYWKHKKLKGNISKFVAYARNTKPSEMKELLLAP